MIANAQTAPDIDEMYLQAKPMIDKITSRFAYLYMDDVDELRSLCNEVFMDSYISWDPERSPFTKRLRSQLQWRLLDRMRMRIKQAKRFPLKYRDTIDVEATRDAKRTDCVQELLDIVTPRFKLEALAGNRKATTEARREIRSTCRKLGWTIREIRRAWAEMKEFASA